MGQLLGSDGLMGRYGFVIEIDKVLDAQPVDVVIVCGALHGEVLAEIGAVGANKLGEFRNRNVVLQKKLRFLTVLFQ